MSVPWLVGATVATLVGLAAAAWLLRGDPARGRRRCGRCWYDMSRVVGLICPECGREVRSERGLRRTRRRWGWMGCALGLVAAGILMWGEQLVGWPQLVPASVWRGVMPYLDPRAKDEIEASGLATSSPIYSVSRWERLRHAYRCSLVLDGIVGVTPKAGSTARLDALVGIMGAGEEGRIAEPGVWRVFRAADAPPRERRIALVVLLFGMTRAEGLAFAERTVFEDPEPQIRVEAFDHIRRCASEDATLIPILVRMCRAPAAGVRRDAAEVLGWHDADAAGALAELDRLASEDPSVEVRDLATGAAERIRAAVQEQR